MPLWKNLMKAALKQAAKPPTRQPENRSWSEAVRHYKEECAYFKLGENDAWNVIVPDTLIITAKEDKRRKSARSLEIEEISDADEFAILKEEIKDDNPREDFETEAEWKKTIKEETEFLKAHIKWSDMFIIVPVRLASGEQIAVAVRERDSQSIGSGNHRDCPEAECFSFQTYHQIDD